MTITTEHGPDFPLVNAEALGLPRGNVRLCGALPNVGIPQLIVGWIGKELLEEVSNESGH
jgi:hypothetical protein